MNKDEKNCLLYILNGAICELIEYANKYPTIEQVRNYPSVAIHGNEISDNDIIEIINNIRKIDEREFLNRHNHLSEFRPNYYGFRRIVEDENGQLVIKFCTNDSLCKRLAERIFNS